MVDNMNSAAPVRCKEMVWNGWNKSGCSRKATKDGYCKQHHPDTVEAKRLERRAKDDARWAVRTRKHDRETKRPADYMEALRQIAAGHNDARTLAAEVLAKWDDAHPHPGDTP